MLRNVLQTTREAVNTECRDTKYTYMVLTTAMQRCTGHLGKSGAVKCRIAVKRNGSQLTRP